MDFPELSGFYIRFSKFDWLLLCSFLDRENDYYYTYLFFNPFTRQKIQLPGFDEYFYTMSFSSPPTSSDCFVIALTWDHKFGIIRRGEEKWNFYGSSKNDEYVPDSHLAICGDRCYAIGDETKILGFDLKRKSINFLGSPLPKKSSLVSNKAKYLVENGSQLLDVIVPHGEQNIYVARMNQSKREWLPVENLKNKMLFISQTASMLKPAPVKSASNKIYFPKIINEDTFVPYCLTTKKYTSFLGDADYCNGSVKQWQNCTWIETIPFAPVFACNQQINW